MSVKIRVVFIELHGGPAEHLIAPLRRPLGNPFPRTVVGKERSHRSAFRRGIFRMCMVVVEAGPIREHQIALHLMKRKRPMGIEVSLGFIGVLGLGLVLGLLLGAALGGALVYAKLKEYKKAINAFKYSLKIAPGKIDVYKEMASVYKEKGDLEEARKALEKAHRIKPEDKEISALWDAVQQK